MVGFAFRSAVLARREEEERNGRRWYGSGRYRQPGQDGSGQDRQAAGSGEGGVVTGRGQSGRRVFVGWGLQLRRRASPRAEAQRRSRRMGARGRWARQPRHRTLIGQTRSLLGRGGSRGSQGGRQCCNSGAGRPCATVRITVPETSRPGREGASRRIGAPARVHPRPAAAVAVGRGQSSAAGCARTNARRPSASTLSGCACPVLGTCERGGWLLRTAVPRDRPQHSHTTGTTLSHHQHQHHHGTLTTVPMSARAFHRIPAKSHPSLDRTQPAVSPCLRQGPLPSSVPVLCLCRRQRRANIAVIADIGFPRAGNRHRYSHAVPTAVVILDHDSGDARPTPLHGVPAASTKKVHARRAVIVQRLLRLSFNASTPGTRRHHGFVSQSGGGGSWRNLAGPDPMFPGWSVDALRLPAVHFFISPC